MKADLYAAASAAPAQSRAPARFSRIAVALHWMIAALLLAQVTLGWWMLGVPKQPPGLRAGWFNLHKSIGLTLAVLIVLRIAWRLTHPAPQWPAALSRWHRVAATTVHAGLYACMVLMPLSGYLGSSFTRYPIRYFGTRLPGWGWDWPAAKHLMSAIHDTAAWTLSILLAIHVLAALWHATRRDGIFSRMWPNLKGESE